MFLTRRRASSKLSIGARIAMCALAAVALLVQPNVSRADILNWLTDLVRESPDPENTSLSGVALPPDAIVTGKDEVRPIQLGADLIELHPSTAVTIEVSGRKTTVRVLGGTIRAKVAKRKPDASFSVETATLVGTVKGTEFEVSAIGGASALSVYEGRVAVKAAGYIGGLDVTPGRTATVASSDRAPRLGKTPPGGAAEAARARVGTPDRPANDRDGGGNREASAAGRPSGGGSTNSSGGPTSGSGGSGRGGGSEGGEGDGDGEGGEGGEGGDDD